uniref:Myb-like domain-containing protein n=2 Tax=Brassica oleracea TaxID=3712 RepID=A0A0D3CHR3_BRAOL|nr:unnamed protein product [Brassica oleracea]
MDSRNPYSHSSTYLSLLHSQQPSVVHENFPYESFHSSSVNLGSSEIPPFSSQQTEAPTQPEVTPVERRERKKWTPADDEVLISAWLNTSKDAIVANDHNAQTFWKRVGQYYAASRHATEGEKREHLHCKQMWHKINERAFGVLQAKFAVIKNPSNLWDKSKIENIMRACIILNNMIVEDERYS